MLRIRGGWQQGLEPSLHDYFPSKQIWWRMHTWKDDEVLLGLSFPASKHQEKVFMNFFNRIFGHQEV